MKIPRLWAALAAGCAIGLLTAFGPGGRGLAQLAEIEASLNLDAAQKAQFDSATTATRTAFASAQARHAVLEAAVDAEMAKARPDLAALAALQDGELAQAQAAHQAVRTEWLRLYSMLDDTQAAVVKVFLQQKIERVEELRERRDGVIKGRWG